MPVLTFRQGEKVRFHVMALGTEGEWSWAWAHACMMEVVGAWGTATRLERA